ncbi:DNA replication ATP-dependent helicase/nuclease DNA2 [Orchesella cincta]|uniref:DNA replication ATP-dependent helicase/nuclease n=1 Tax=Orchesella cincta TaxID=48709 RepID=A0A1D2N5K0_ORCCI|nr:DNA replication ATP-dependent helicase/nuclease DNA2 [Orchesella cincta]
MASPVSTLELDITVEESGTIIPLYDTIVELNLRNVLNENVESDAAKKLFFDVVWKKLATELVFVDTSDVPAEETRVEESICNEAEAHITMIWTLSFKTGIVAPYRGQVELGKALKRISDTKFREVEVNTVGQYQGREKEVILCTCTRSIPMDSPFFLATAGEKNEGILEDMRRLNVAITRSKVVLLGNRHTLKEYSLFQDAV